MKVLLIVPDNGSYISTFPLGIAYIAATLRERGDSVEIYCKDVYHYSEEHLTNFLNEHNYDVIGTGTCGGYYQYREMKNIAQAIKKSTSNAKFVVGGHLVTPEPEYFINLLNADYIVLGEGEETMKDLVYHLESNFDVDDVKGIAYKKSDGTVKINERRELIKDIDSIPFPAWDLFPMDHYTLLRMPNIGSNERCMVMYSGRGCLFRCNFCYRMDKGFRPRSADSVIEEMRILKERYNVSYIAFFDELLVSSVERVTEFCEKLIAANLNMKWDCNGRLNFAKKEMLELMKKAGCVFINYGIESMDEEALKRMNKSLTTSQIIKGIENTLAAGISPGYNIIFGNIGETGKSLQLGVDFLLKYDDHSQLRTIRPVTPYPGCPLYYYAIEQGLLKDVEDFYENKHVNSDLLAVNFTPLSDDEFYNCLRDANKALLNNYYDSLKKNAIEIEENLYNKRDASFRGFRRT
ncbi:B12-binding domain-containing radical SAM protein [Anaerovibrio sp.]|uniref:B12-binding domain-containing radical SAM protein n=1 Tax=Anaerovibrio sp. TaxID=1872532 RepID=UPI00388EE2D3